MQPSLPPQRPSQRRQQNLSEVQQPARQSSDSQQQPSQSRNTSGSARSYGSKVPNPDKQISQIEKSVTHLLVATKQLLETLTQWSRGNAQEEEVSDVYVRLGYEFNLACRAFNSIGVETSDLGPVPDLLRSILEDTLSQPASPQALDNYLPRIRDIIINLLHGLKRKQSKLRSKGSKDGTNKPVPLPGRQSSLTNAEGGEPSLNTMMESVPGQAVSTRSENRRDSPVGPEDQAKWGFNNPSNTSSLERSAPIRRSTRREVQTLPSQDSASSMSSTAAQKIPVMEFTTEPDEHTNLNNEQPIYGPTLPPNQDALTALQRGGDLERRASRRFSAYQIQKHLGASPNGVPVIPPAQNSPIPNRGREVRESMSAVRSRTSYQHARQMSSNGKFNDISPSRNGMSRAPQRISEERDEIPDPPQQDIPTIQTPDDDVIDSPTVKTPDEYHSPRLGDSTSTTPSLGATVNGPFSPTKEQQQMSLPTQSDEGQKELPQIMIPTYDQVTIPAETSTAVTPTQALVNELESVTPPRSKELTLFLQYKSKIKKFVLGDDYEELSLARLQLAFIEKFQWHTHNNGADLPEIYIQDPVSGVRHELEDLSDVKDRSVLVLNVEVLDEVKKHFDEGLGSIRTTLEGFRSLLDGQGTMMERVSDRQLETSKEMARLSAVPTNRASRPPGLPSTPGIPVPASEAARDEVNNLRRDIAVLRQTYASMSSDFAAAMKDIKAKALNVKAVAAEAAIPSYEGDAGRSHVNQGKKTLMTDSEALVNRVDDLSDIVEDLRKDVVTRGVRPRPHQLEEINKEISTTVKALTKMKEFLKREKPIWTKIWEQELNLVCTERDDLTQQEDLMADLHGDLEDVTNVFKLVEEAMKQQNLQSGTTGGLGGVVLRSTSRALDIDPNIDPNTAKEGVLDEVRALRPNHENRLEAIERAEKLRQKELETRKVGVFQREVEKFVEEGKLKKTGGADEVERLRKIKDERARKENWDRAQARQAEQERKAAEEAAAATAATTASTTATSNTDEPTQVDDTEHITQQTRDDASQDGESVFQDVKEAITSTTETEAEDEHPPKPISHALTNDETSHHDSRTSQETEQPKLPGINVGTSSVHSGTGRDSAASVKPADSEQPRKSTDSASSSWWKPAIFATN